MTIEKQISDANNAFITGARALAAAAPHIDLLMTAPVAPDGPPALSVQERVKSHRRRVLTPTFHPYGPRRRRKQINGEHNKAIRLAARLYGFDLPDWPPDRVRACLLDIAEEMRHNGSIKP